MPINKRSDKCLKKIFTTDKTIKLILNSSSSFKVSLKKFFELSQTS